MKLTNYHKLAISSVVLITGYLLFSIARYWYADLLYAQGQTQEALALFPNEPNYNDKFATTLSEIALEKPEFAEIAYAYAQNAIDLNPYNLNLRKSYANVLLDLGKIDPKYVLPAIDDLQEAARLAPTDPAILYILGQVYAQNKDYIKAVEYFEKAIKLKPDYKKALNALEIVKHQ